MGGYRVAGKGVYYEREFDLISKFKYATIEFDFFSIDSWDNEYFQFFVNNARVINDRFQWG